MLTNLDTNINTKEEFINTIFYFVESLSYDEYREMCVSGKIAMRTIVFARQQRAIYKGGDMYCPMEDSTFLSILLRLLNDEDLINALLNFIKNHRGDLPIATKELLGVIMVGATLTITNQGVLDVDIEEIEKIIKKYIKGEGSSDFPKASKEEYGVVKIGDGIAVNDGVISVSFGELPEQTKQDLLNLVLKFIRENANFRATYNRYGVVKIKEGGGILVNDGVISIDPIAIPSMPSIPDPVDYSITNFSLNGNNLTISQNNNSRSLVVDLSQYVNTGGSGSGSDGQNGGHYEFAYKNSATKPNPPAAGTSVANLTGGWTTTPADPGNNEYTWMSWCFVNGVTGEYGTWSTPIRITGQKGDKGDTGAAGSGVDITVEQIDQITNTTIQEIKNQIEEQNNYWNTWVDNEINNAITRILQDLNNSDWFTIMNSSGWDEEMKAYLQRIGLLEVYTDSSTGETTIRDRFSEIIQRLSSIEATVGDINVGVDDQGNMLNVTQLKSDIATWLENNDEFKGAIAQSILSYIDWDAIGNTVTSAVSALQQRAGLTENGLEAVSSQTARVDNGEDATLSAIQAFANEQRSSINLTASFSKYKTDGNGNYVYYDGSQDGYEMVYESDSDGKAIPYCGIKVFYVKSDGTLTLDASEGVTKKQIVRQRDNQGRVRLWDASNNEINLDTATDSEKAQGVPHYVEEEVKDGNGDPVKDRKAKMVYYIADSNGDYIGNSSYVFEEDLKHDSDGQLVWVKDSTYEVKFIDEPGRSIAYRKNRKMENISFASLGLTANEQNALATLVANYLANDGSGIESHAALTQLASANSAIAGLQAEVHQAQTDINDLSSDVDTLNTFKTSASTTFVASADYNREKNNFVTKGGIVSAITSENETNNLKSVLSGAGVLTSADLSNSESELYAEFAGVKSSIASKVGIVDGKIQSGVTISADQIELTGTTFAEKLVPKRLVSGTDGSKGFSIGASYYQSLQSDIRYGVLGNNGYVDYPSIYIGSPIRNSVKATGDFINTLVTELPTIEISEFSSNERTYSSILGAYGLTIRHASSQGTWSGYTHAVDAYVTDSTANIYVGESGGSSTNYTPTGAVTTSDIRKKDIVENINLPIESIAESPVFKYKFKNSTNGSIYIGTSAQYWQEIIPEVVSTDLDGYLMMNYTSLNTVASLTCAKELVKLKEENAELKERLAAIEEKLGI